MSQGEVMMSVVIKKWGARQMQLALQNRVGRGGVGCVVSPTCESIGTARVVGTRHQSVWWGSISTALDKTHHGCLLGPLPPQGELGHLCHTSQKMWDSENEEHSSKLDLIWGQKALSRLKYILVTPKCSFHKCKHLYLNKNRKPGLGWNCNLKSKLMTMSTQAFKLGFDFCLIYGKGCFLRKLESYHKHFLSEWFISYRNQWEFHFVKLCSYK